MSKIRIVANTLTRTIGSVGWKAVWGTWGFIGVFVLYAIMPQLWTWIQEYGRSHFDHEAAQALFPYIATLVLGLTNGLLSRTACRALPDAFKASCESEGARRDRLRQEEQDRQLVAAAQAESDRNAELSRSNDEKARTVRMLSHKITERDSAIETQERLIEQLRANMKKLNERIESQENTVKLALALSEVKGEKLDGGLTRRAK